MKTIKLICVLMSFLALGMSNQSLAQTVPWKFDAADNSGLMILITSVGGETVTKIELARKGDAAWTATTLVSSDENQEYFRIKSSADSKIYEIYVYWEEDKLVRIYPDGKELIYWLRKE